MKVFTIAELENITGVRSHTIRIWEKRHFLLKPQRSRTNIRFYTINEAEELLNISLLNRHGFKISRLSTLTTIERKQKIAELKSIEATYDKALKDLLLSIFMADADNFEFILDSCTASLGTDRTVTNIIFPFLERTRGFWYKPGINPIQDHFINIVRRKLYVAIEKASATASNKGLCMLFLPPGHGHDLHLLCNYYTCRNAGFKVIYLAGTSTIEHIEWAAKAKQPDFIIIHLTGKGRINANELLQTLTLRFPETPLLVHSDISFSEEMANLKVIPGLIEMEKYLSDRQR